MIEVTAFRLAEGADEAAFLAADKKLQTEFAYQQPGLLRRTTARGKDRGFVVIDVWRSAADADACEVRWETDPLVAAFLSFVDPATVRNQRFEELE